MDLLFWAKAVEVNGSTRLYAFIALKSRVLITSRTSLDLV